MFIKIVIISLLSWLYKVLDDKMIKTTLDKLVMTGAVFLIVAYVAEFAYVLYRG